MKQHAHCLILRVPDVHGPNRSDSLQHIMYEGTGDIEHPESRRVKEGGKKDKEVWSRNANYP